ncbi:MAG TPA: DNA-binding domain-containing protein [Burkholderiales bacterium]|nr:DNA-binding domain-containing protein [Burkholderiales bacterium]
MPELFQLQRLFAGALASRAAADAALPAFAGDPAKTARRLAIYRGNVHANAGKALRAAYPVVAALVGEEFFQGLARAYSEAIVSRSGDLNEYGAEFTRFLADFPHTQDLPYLPDVARLEWAVHLAHYAADREPLNPARLAGFAQEHQPALRFRLHPACVLLTSRWPIARIWEVHQADHTGAFDVDMDCGMERALVFRPGFRVRVRSLGPAEHVFLSALARRQTLADALQAALAVEAAFGLQETLIRLIGESVIVEVELQ